MDGAFVAVSTESQAYGLAAGSKPLVLLGERTAEKTTRMGDSNSVRFSDSEGVRREDEND